MFVTFEGIDGSGKTTQLNRLRDYLLKRGISTRVVREPGGTVVGESIRKLLLNSKTTGLDPLGELLLYYASRSQNLVENLIPALEAKEWVLCDRFADASMAYQGYGRGIDLEVIHKLNQIVLRDHKPDLTILIDIEPEISLHRARARDRQRLTDEKRFEMESLEFFRRVRAGYLIIARENAERMRVVQGDAPPEVIQENIQRIIQDYGI